MDLGTLQIRSLIVHEVPRRLASSTGLPVLSDKVSPLQPAIRNFFQERLQRTLGGTSAFAVVFDETSNSPCRGQVDTFLQGNSSLFVSSSRDMANHLNNVQTGAMSGGLLTVINGRHASNQRCMAILKLEKEEGARARLEGKAGDRTFNIEHLRELLLTGGTRVFKAALFWQEDDQTVGLVSDNQRGFQARVEIANFFLRTFLGCSLREDPRVATRRLFRATEDFINTEIDDPEDRANYEMALLVEMNSQLAQFNPSSFAQAHLDVRHRQPYVEYLQLQDVPTHAISKNVELISGQLAQVQMNFKSGMRLYGPREQFKDRVDVKKEESGTVVSVRDEVTRVHGR